MFHTVLALPSTPLLMCLWSPWHLVCTGIVLLATVTYSCNAGEVLDDTLCVHSLPSSGFSAGVNRDNQNASFMLLCIQSLEPHTLPFPVLSRICPLKRAQCPRSLQSQPETSPVCQQSARGTAPQPLGVDGARSRDEDGLVLAIWKRGEATGSALRAQACVGLGGTGWVPGSPVSMY